MDPTDWYHNCTPQHLTMIWPLLVLGIMLDRLHFQLTFLGDKSTIHPSIHPSCVYSTYEDLQTWHNAWSTAASGISTSWQSCSACVTCAAAASLVADSLSKAAGFKDTCWAASLANAFTICDHGCRRRSDSMLFWKTESAMRDCYIPQNKINP